MKLAACVLSMIFVSSLSLAESAVTVSNIEQQFTENHSVWFVGDQVIAPTWSNEDLLEEEALEAELAPGQVGIYAASTNYVTVPASMVYTRFSARRDGRYTLRPIFTCKNSPYYTYSSKHRYHQCFAITGKNYCKIEKNSKYRDVKITAANFPDRQRVLRKTFHGTITLRVRCR